MAYIPPHLRVSTSRPKPSPDTPSPSPSVRGPNLHAGRNRKLLPDVAIVKSAHFISRLIVLSCNHVEFAKFDGDTFAHLQQLQLYILKAATIDNANASQDSYELSLQERPARLIVGVLQEDLKGVLEEFKGFSHADNVGRLVPLMWLKFGKLLFHDRSNLRVEWHKSYMPKEVEMMNGGGRGLLKTFDNSISLERFSFLQEFAHRNALNSWSKERYTIQVSDETRPDTLLLCMCTHSKCDEHRSLSSKNPAKSALTMGKVRLSPIRYMTSDVACVGKSNDIRLMFFIKEFLTGLSEEELQDLESCLSKASVDYTVKGGLRWPLGSRQSTSGRFKVVGGVHEIKTTVVGSGLKWSFQKCNRVEFKASSGRISHEVGVRPVVYHEFCKAREERTVEEIMSSIADVIQQVYQECI